MSVRRAATPLRPGLTSRPASHWVLAVLMIGLVGLFCTSSGMQQLGAAWGPLLRQPAPLRFDHFTVAQWQQPALRLAPAGSKQYFDAGSSQYKEEALGNLTAHRGSLFALGMATSKLKQADWLLRYKPAVTCPSEAPLTRYGRSGDGGKFLCALEGLRAPCTVLSFGSQNDYTFEQDVLSKTPCHVHTFDCTVDGWSVHERHTFHKECIDGDSWASYIQGKLGLTSIQVLKADIEGAELDLLASWQDRRMVLPQQLALEIHRTRGRESANTFHALLAHLATLGYAAFSLELNPTCKGCAELSYVRLQG